MSAKLRPGEKMPDVVLPILGGGTLRLGESGHWRVVLVYRGHHSALCKGYLRRAQTLLADFRRIDTELVAISADSEDRAAADAQALELEFPVAYGLQPGQMEALGLFMTEPARLGPATGGNAGGLFPEPALFVVTPEGRAQIIDVSNAPFSRPDLNNILGGLAVIQQSDYPIMGTHLNTSSRSTPRPRRISP